VPAYIRLVHTIPEQKTAFLRNIVYREPERKLIATANSGYDTFRVTDADTGFVFFKAKVLRIDARALYFQVKDEIFELQIGKDLADAVMEPLSSPEIEALALDAYFDEEWALEETGKGKSSSKKTPTRKGSSKSK
jgi:hypothetical protein